MIKARIMKAPKTLGLPLSEVPRKTLPLTKNDVRHKHFAERGSSNSNESNSSIFVEIGAKKML